MGGSRNTVRILLLQMRQDPTIEKVERESILRSAQLQPEQLVALNAFHARPTDESLRGVSALIIGGSASSVFEPFPHAEEVTALIRAAREKRLPIFGICFGAQLLAHAFGGKVERDVEHEEFGTFPVATNDDAIFDMLFADAPDSFMAQCSHHDRIVALPPKAVALASSARCPIQAFVFPGEDIYGFQFHPERNKADFAALIALKQNDAVFERASQTLQESPDAEKLVAKFVDRIVAGR